MERIKRLFRGRSTAITALTESSSSTTTNKENIGRFTDWKAVYLVTIVSLIGTIEQTTVGPIIWPYMQKLDTSLNEDFYGVLNSISSVGRIVTSVICGYLVNLGPMVASKALAIVSCAVYLSVELWNTTGQKIAFVVFELFIGVSVGASTVNRAHISDVSTEGDRARAVAISTMASSLSMLLTPITQFAFQPLGYPGASFFFGTHLNIFTAPILFVLIICAVGAVILIVLFDGRMLRARKRREEKALLDKPKEDKGSIADLSSGPKTLGARLWGDGCTGFDWVAVIVCWFTKLVWQAIILVYQNVIPPYSMLAFGWTSDSAILYQSILMGIVGVFVIAVNVGYIFFNLRKRLHERTACVISLGIFVASFLLTFPWPFLSGTISDNAKDCAQRFAWCTTTPAANVVLYFVAFGFAMGTANPLIIINLDSLYSKVLGPIPQGTMQGVYTVGADIISIVGPIVVSQVYTVSGPTYIWIFISALIVVCLALWAVFFKRMISHAERNPPTPAATE